MIHQMFKPDKAAYANTAKPDFVFHTALELLFSSIGDIVASKPPDIHALGWVHL